MVINCAAVKYREELRCALDAARRYLNFVDVCGKILPSARRICMNFRQMGLRSRMENVVYGITLSGHCK